MQRNPPQSDDRTARTDHEIPKQSGLAGDYVSEFEAGMIRFAISCSLLAALTVIGSTHDSILELAMLATAVGAMVMMVHKGQIEDPTA